MPTSSYRLRCVPVHWVTKKKNIVFRQCVSVHSGATVRPSSSVENILNFYLTLQLCIFNQVSFPWVKLGCTMTSLLPKYRNDQPEDGQHHDRTLKRMMSYSYKLCLLTLVVICMPVFIRELGNSLKSMAESDTSEEPAAMQQVYDGNV